MHGIIMQQFQQFVSTNYGYPVWMELSQESSSEQHFFFPTRIYPDQQIVQLVTSFASKMEMSVAQVLEEFGLFLAPTLLRVYASSIRKEWKTLDLVEHTENTMYKATRLNNGNTSPSILDCKRVNENKVQVSYTSKRKMIELGIGIIKGFAKHYREEIKITVTDTENGKLLEIERI